MTLDEKLAQIVGFWENDEEGDTVALLQGQQTSGAGRSTACWPAE